MTSGIWLYLIPSNVSMNWYWNSSLKIFLMGIQFIMMLNHSSIFVKTEINCVSFGYFVNISPMNDDESLLLAVVCWVTFKAVTSFDEFKPQNTKWPP